MCRAPPSLFRTKRRGHRVARVAPASGKSPTEHVRAHWEPMRRQRRAGRNGRADGIPDAPELGASKARARSTSPLAPRPLQTVTPPLQARPNGSGLQGPTLRHALEFLPGRSRLFFHDTSRRATWGRAGGPAGASPDGFAKERPGAAPRSGKKKSGGPERAPSRATKRTNVPFATMFSLNAQQRRERRARDGLALDRPRAPGALAGKRRGQGPESGGTGVGGGK